MNYVSVPVIKNPSDYQEALSRLDEIFDAQPGTPESDEMDILLLMIKDYEDKNTSIELADPIDVIRHVMELKGLKQSDLAEWMGGKNRVSEVLNRKRALTIEMIRNLSQKLHIPAEALLKI